MIRRITLINFMSHVETVIDLADGLTVLVGPNNSGKSAVVEAIQTVCQNNPTKYMVRHGENECRVVIETDEGHIIQWKRKGAVVSYTLNGQDVHRLGGGVPDNLDQLLRLPLIESPDGRDKFNVHIGPQKEPVFLLDQSGGKAAMFFASASDARLLLEMQRLHKKKSVERRRDESLFSERANKLQELLVALEPLPQIDCELAEAEEKRDQVQELIDAIDGIQSLVGEIERTSQDAKLQSDRGTALAPLAVPPTLRDLFPLENLIESLGNATQNEMHQSELTETLVKLNSPPALAGTAALQELCQEMGENKGIVAALGAETAVMRDLPFPPVMHDIEPLNSLCQSLSRQHQEVSRLENRLACLHNLPVVPMPLDPTPISELSRNLNEAIFIVDQQQREQEKIEEQFTDVKGRIGDWAKANPTCPMCGALMDENRLIQGGPHRHG